MKISKKRKKTPRDIIISQRCTKNHDHMLYCSWDMACDVYNYFSFCPFTLLRTQKVKIKKKMKEKPGDIIILHKCTKNHDHMLYCSWDIAHDGCNCYFSFWAIFCPFTPLTAQKMKISKKWKKPLEISFYTSVPKLIIICYTVPEIWCMMDVIVIFHFGLFFALLPLQQPEKWKFPKKWKKSWRYHHFTKVYQKPWLYGTLLLRYGAWRM